MARKIREPLTMGVDLGGTKVKLVVLDATGQVLYEHKTLIQSDKKPKRIITNIVDFVNTILKQTGYEVKALGIGVAAQVDPTGVVYGSPNLGWRNIPLKQELEKQLSFPITITNDVRAAAWGEWCYGSGIGINDLVVLFVGTGIGGGVIVGGKILSGCYNSGGELGHMTLFFGGRKCRCPNRGCLEAYSGGWAIAKRAQEAILAAPMEGKYLISLSGVVEKVTAATVGRAYHDGDILARNLVEDTGLYLAAGAVSIVNAFNPCLLILGGGVIEGIPELLKMVEDVVPNTALEANAKKLKIKKAMLGDNAGAIGAAAIAHKLVNNSP